MKAMIGHAAAACASLATKATPQQGPPLCPERRVINCRAAVCDLRVASRRGLSVAVRTSGKAGRALSTRGSRRLRIVAEGCDNGGAVHNRRPRDANRAVDMEHILAERDACGVGFIANLENSASHKVLADALTGLSCMEHRGGCSSDNISGDGSGVMTQVPWKLLQAWAKGKDMEGAIDPETAGVGMVFLSQDSETAAKGISICEDRIKECGFELIGWRDVPTDASVCGKWAKKTLPQIKQLIVKSVANETGETLDRSLYLLRKKIEWSVREQNMDDSDLHFCSLSNSTIVYKGMLYSSSLGLFFNDLMNPLYESVFAIYHRRFSTNTLPKWHLAQPMRFLGHNGEINTVQGNLNWVSAREDHLGGSIFAEHETSLTPISNSQLSDSANLDRMAELLVLTGKGPEEAMMILVPEAYRNHPDLENEVPELADFYEFYSGLQEPWDGPALLIFSDGKKVGACLDRNGLRPARYWKSSDGFLYVASEVGVIPCDPSTVTFRGRLGPGQMVSVDLESGAVDENLDAKAVVANKHPYSQWLSASRQTMPSAGFLEKKTMEESELMSLQTAFGYGSEDVQLIIEPMAMSAKEPTYCMGDDSPLAVLSEKPHLIYNYFKQRFAQVTNPAIDPLREGLVMGVEMFIGARGNLFSTDLSNEGRQLKLSSPVLGEKDLVNLEQTEFLKPTKHQMMVKPNQSLKEAVEDLCASVIKEVRAGSQCVILSDRFDINELPEGVTNIPALLATGAVHHHLIAEGNRMNASIIVDTAQCFSTHHFATLVGYGASAICPYLALETCRAWQASKRTQTLIKQKKMENVSMAMAQENYKKAVNGGLKKILSKMGISLLSSYHSAQIFEIYGLGKDVVDLAFKGSVSRIGGLTMEEVEAETKMIWNKAFESKDEIRKLENFGFIKFVRAREYHGNNPEMSKLLHQAVRTGDEELFKSYQEYLDQAPVSTLRDTLELSSPRKPISINEVEPVTKIVERFCTGGMSLGAISRECHEVIAVAMNRLGGKSNSGEGGEDPNRFQVVEDVDKEGNSDSFPHLRGMRNGDIATSKIKQVASGRFGVSAYFLSHAEQIEIKIAQGAKPGEGGQLPGKKVSKYIAELRKSKPGVQLISPPPHHDIYSIEDLAQLIYDLHQVNERAKVSVKLVSEAGIGTVASGVAKAGADVIQVSGHDGGTGASPISSIKHAGGPWEMGLVETHQTLVDNELRDRVILRVDGGLRNGRDIILAAALGADEFGFGTVAMIATGCIMARICHTNDCPVGVASQREELRARFPGTPEDVVNFFCFLGEEVRQRLADLGYKSLDDVIGNTEILKIREDNGASKTENLDLGFILQSSSGSSLTSTERRSQTAHSNGQLLDDEVLSRPSVKECIEKHAIITEQVNIVNTDRSFCARIGGTIASMHGDTGFKGQLNLEVHGSAGQSFGAFMVDGMNIKLYGESNDYVCKSISGGTMAIIPYENSTYDPAESVIVGNTCLYGATGGEVYIRGMAGERFAVRNSRGNAVVEGAGDHCCEYMTGGCVVVLGRVGRNIGAGMTGGITYIYAVGETDFEKKVNKESLTICEVNSPKAKELLRSMLAKHFEATGSERAQSILADFSSELKNFRMLVPESEREYIEVAATERQNTQVVPSSS